ncbi:DUF6282 family protein [Sphaerochaeta sp. PS]|uniref:DUF6282 family protein n=1 Tax=Sphaerochaeta sp. PS TaxID=3076336 RepID=UPI0028A5711B|nr:DUF6282 family protein [Sphaerochaeta sp. PS]MDT4762642.1 DUF6282 family protein [Sphaerochaeta sp. PS]
MNIWEGAWDLHVHTAPDVIGRKVTDHQLMQRLIACGMKGYAIKSHISSTTGRAKLMNEIHPGATAIGTITLNNAVGGINPFAVELAVMDGAKLVWLPTIDSKNESDHIMANAANASDRTKMPFFAKFRVELAEKGKLQPPIYTLENGKLTKNMLEVLDIVVEHNIALASGHVSQLETFAIAEECHRRGYKKFIVTHPNFPSTTFTKEEQKELVKKGAIMEQCFTTPYTGKITWERAFDEIRYVGTENCMISTDLGQPAYVYPDEGIKIYCEKLLENGFTEEQVRTMVCVNPEFIVNG